jgi:hypothetical protein
MLNENLNKLNCNNYHVSEDETGDYWFAQNGLRSLYHYSKMATKMDFRTLCLRMIETGEVTIEIDSDTEDTLTLTLI